MQQALAFVCCDTLVLQPEDNKWDDVFITWAKVHALMMLLFDRFMLMLKRHPHSMHFTLGFL